MYIIQLYCIFINLFKASLTAARACANSIYCQPILQADIDLMSGILNSTDKDYKTAYNLILI